MNQLWMSCIFKLITCPLFSSTSIHQRIAQKIKGVHCDINWGLYSSLSVNDKRTLRQIVKDQLIVYFPPIFFFHTSFFHLYLFFFIDWSFSLRPICPFCLFILLFYLNFYLFSFEGKVIKRLSIKWFYVVSKYFIFMGSPPLGFMRNIITVTELSNG